MKDFFISYNHADRAWAEWIAWQLEEAGYTTVLQAWDFRAGANFVAAMNRATMDADRTVAVLSDDYLGASFTAPEWGAAFSRDPSGEKGKLVPVRVRECAVAGLLGQIVYIDLVGLEEDDARRALTDGVQSGRGKPAASPRFPVAHRHTAERQPPFPNLLPAIDSDGIRKVENDPTLSGAEKLFLVSMWEIAEMDKMALGLLGEIVEIDRQVSAMAEEMDSLGGPGQRIRRAAFGSQSEELKRKRSSLSDELEELREQRALSMQKVKVLNIKDRNKLRKLFRAGG